MIDTLYLVDTPYGSPIVWELPEPIAKSSPSPLSRPDIVGAAIRIADAEGLDNVSFRKVAGALEAGPMRLYGFIRSKEDLLELMIDEVHGEILAGSETNHVDWQARLLEIALAYRSAAFDHPWLVDLLGGRPHLGPNALAVLESTASALDSSPRRFDAGTLWSALGAVNAYIFGAVRSDVVQARAPLSADRADNRGETYLRTIIDSGRIPTLQRIASANEPDGREDFVWGLKILLTGIAVD